MHFVILKLYGYISDDPVIESNDYSVHPLDASCSLLFCRIPLCVMDVRVTIILMGGTYRLIDFFDFRLSRTDAQLVLVFYIRIVSDNSFLQLFSRPNSLVDG